MTIELNFRPRPVSVTTPTMMPAPAQVAPTLSMPSAPPSIALAKPDCSRCCFTEPLPRNRSQGISAVSRRSMLVASATTVAQNTESTGEKPQSMKATIETSERKWNQ